MTIKQVFESARETLARYGIEDASLEAELLLRHTLKINRAQFYTESDKELSKKQIDKYFGYIQRRIEGEPSAYITGHREFYGFDFKVNKDVLIPRPETEFLVEQAIIYADKRTYSCIADVGTGCGAIAVCLAIHLPAVSIHALDVSKAALKVAKDNCKIRNVADRVKFHAGDLLEPLPEKVDMIVANLPYVLTDDLSSVNTFGFEPQLALDGGNDGLEIIERLCVQSRGKLKPGGCMMLEIGRGQGETTAEIIHGIYPFADISFILDYNEIPRVVRVLLSE